MYLYHQCVTTHLAITESVYYYNQWRQTLIYIGGALNNKFQILYIIGGAKSNFI